MCVCVAVAIDTASAIFILCSLWHLPSLLTHPKRLCPDQEAKIFSPGPERFSVGFPEPIECVSWSLKVSIHSNYGTK